MAEPSPDAYRSLGSDVRLPPDIVPSFARERGRSRVEIEAEKIADEMLGLLAGHGVPLTSELRAATGDLALAAVLSRDRR